MAIYHILSMTFNQGLPQEEIKAACDKLLSLSDNCLHPTSKKPYIKIVGVGKENSIEGLQNGVSHVMIAEFQSEEDREYYVHSDPFHHSVIKALGPKLSKIQVVDFTPGEL
ncbi:stress responsive A/B barrel domain-containing protein [Xylaria nigripes]|nr:stress responsive A/B barrel domain-containing protein [Xylaria nigripes]